MLATIMLPDRTLDITHVMPSMTTVTSYVLDIYVKSRGTFEVIEVHE